MSHRRLVHTFALAVMLAVLALVLVVRPAQPRPVTIRAVPASHVHYDTQAAAAAAAQPTIDEIVSALAIQADLAIQAERAKQRQHVASAPTTDYSSMEPCGGDLPPCWVKYRESKGNYGAFNPTGCVVDGRAGCYGAWQFGWFWAGKLGLPDDLSTATPAQQDAAARQLWAGGRGCSNWGAC